MGTYELELDIGVRLDNDHFGSMNSWDNAVSWLKDVVVGELGLEDVSGGTGFGVRDTQYNIPMGHYMSPSEIVQYLEGRAERDGIELEYIGYCLVPSTEAYSRDLTELEVQALHEAANELSELI